MYLLPYYGKSGQIYYVGSLVSKEAKGGEGSVHCLPQNPGLVAKIYRCDVLSANDIKQRARKVESMLTKNSPLASSDSFCAWPQDALYDSDGVFCGYIMRSVEQGVKLSRKLSDKLRIQSTQEELIAIACNLAIAVEQVHSHSYVIGDFKPDNLLVDSHAFITIIDVDSFQFEFKDEFFPCKAGTPEWLPPELQETSFACHSFSAETDRWALAVIIFKLLMNDTHPFTHRMTNPLAERSSQSENVICGLSSHFPETNRAGLAIGEPLTCPPLSTLPPEVCNLFRQTFVDGHIADLRRPAAVEWITPLQQLSQRLIVCSVDVKHIYWEQVTSCPWCAVKRASRVPLTIEPPTSTAPKNKAPRQNPIQQGTSPYFNDIQYRNTQPKDASIETFLTAVGIGLAIVGAFVLIFLLLVVLLGV